MSVIPLSLFDLGISSLLIGLIAILSIKIKLNLTKSIIISAIRAVVQLELIGYILRLVFTHVHWFWIGLLALVMLLVASKEVIARQQRKFKGWWGYGFGAFSLFTTCFSITIIALHSIINANPWYNPQYAIPILGMIMGSTLTGIALSLDNLTKNTWQQRQIIEQRLMLGQSFQQAIAPIRRDSIRTAMIPAINAMAVAGIVSLPGMMTGQILAGIIPTEAVKYQILIMFLLTAATTIGTILACYIATHRLTDNRQRLRLDRLISQHKKHKQ